MNLPEIQPLGVAMGAGALRAHPSSGGSLVGEASLSLPSPSSPPTPSYTLAAAPTFVTFSSSASLSSTATTCYTPSVSRPSMASSWGIGGFTTPPMPNPPVVCPNTTTSTMGLPQMPSVTYFNSRAPMGFNFRMASTMNGIPIVFKRKQEEEVEEHKPAAKQHISEERMAAHLNSLHLSESYHNHRLGKKGAAEENDMMEGEGEGEEEDDEEEEAATGKKAGSSHSPCLVIADEIKQIIPGESQLPDTLLKKILKPSMEVVLWQPPGDIIRNFVIPSSSSHNDPHLVECTPSTSTTTPSQQSPSTSSSPPTSQLPIETSSSSTSSSPDSGISISSPPPALSFLSQNSRADVASSSLPESAASSSADAADDLLSLPSTSSGSRGGCLPPLRRPASPLPDPMMEDDFSERMEFNNNNGNAPNFMWLEENNNTALLDLNAVEPYRPPQLEDLPDLPDSDDMDL